MCLDDWRAACEVASTQEDLALWVHTLAGAVKARAAEICRASKVAKKLQEASHTRGYAWAMPAGLVSSQRCPQRDSVCDLPPWAGVLFQTVSEDVFFKMPVAEREKMSTRPLLIKGCSKLKRQPIRVPPLQAQMHRFTEQFSGSLNVKWTGRPGRDTSTKNTTTAQTNGHTRTPDTCKPFQQPRIRRHAFA